MNQNHNISDQELDALFKEADNATGIPAFDDSFWNEMEAMLPKKKRKGVLFWWTSSAALVAVISLLLFFLYPVDRKTASKQIAGSNTPAADHSSSVNQPLAEGSDKSSDNQDVYPGTSGQDHSGNGNSITYPVRKYDRKRPETPVDPDTDMNREMNSQTADLTDKTPGVKTEDAFADLGKQPIRFTTPVTLNNVTDHTANKRIPYYMEFAVGYGQSYKRVDFENNWMSQFRFGGGVYTTIRQMQLSAGLAFRAEVPNNISKSTYSSGYNSQNVLVDVTNTTTMRGLYSIEFPLFIGGTWNRSVLGASMTPGIQLAYTGINTRYENTQIVSREKQSGSIPDSKTMTMEIGLRYGYSITEHVQLSASCNMDVIRPFQSANYNGDNTSYPVSFFLGLRRTF